MAVHYRAQGFVFKKEDRQDADRVFSVFTREFGRVEIFAKAIRKINSKLKGGIDIFALSELEFVQGKNRKTLTDALSVGKYQNLARSPEKMEVAAKACCLLDDFIKGSEPDQKIWDLLADFFQKLDNLHSTFSNQQLVDVYFFWNFVQVLGYGPQLFTCAHCHKNLEPVNLYFSNREGGIICKNCFSVKKEALPVHQDTVKILRIALKKEWETMFKLKFSEDSKKELRQISTYYQEYLINSHAA